jgi:hypothetical protein
MANQVGKGSDGEQDWVAGAALGPGVHTNVIVWSFQVIVMYSAV